MTTNPAQKFTAGLSPKIAALVGRVVDERNRSGLHVRMTGTDDGKPFDYYAKDEAGRDDFIRRANLNGFATEIVER